MTWALVLILFSGTESVMGTISEHDSMTACFDAREKIIEEKGRPIVNYQVVCVAKMEMKTW